MNGERALGTDFTRGNVTGLLLRFMMPLLLAALLNSLYNTIDMIIIGLYAGAEGTVAVAQGGRLLFMLTLVATGLASGGEILISQQMGAGRRDEVRATVGTLFTLLLVISLALGVACLCLSRPIIGWLNTPEESFSQALYYLRITSAGLPLIFGYTAVSAVLRGMGDSKRPLIFIAVAAGVNLVLDLVFIIYLGLGAAGTALATVIGQGVSFVVAVIYLYRHREQFAFDFQAASFVPDREKMNTILRIGVPLALESLLIQSSQLVVISYVNRYGLIQAAAYSVGDRIIQLTNVLSMSARQAGGAMVGQNIGAGRPERVRQVVRSCLGITLIIATALSVVALAFPRALFSLFTSDEEVMAYCVTFMRIVAIIYYLSCGISAFGCVVTGTGNARLGFFSGFLDGVVFRLAFSFFFGIFLEMEVTGFFLGSALARLGPVLVSGTYYFSGAWLRRQALTEKREEGS